MIRFGNKIPSIIILCSSIFGCTKVFDPKGDFEDRLIIHSIISNRTDKALVRVHRTYDADGFNPLLQETDPVVLEAHVQLFVQNSIYNLRDTTITRTDKSRYTENIPAYVFEPFFLVRGGTYELRAMGAGMEISSKINVPGITRFDLVNGYLLEDDKSQQILQLQIRLGSNTYAWMVRALLEYSVSTDSGALHLSIEIPTDILEYNAEIGQRAYAFPEVQRTISDEARRNSPNLRVSNIKGIAIRAYSLYPNNQVKIEKLVLILTQIEENLYRYYSLVNEFNDKKSIRLDEPDFSNISNGVGIFGAFTEDSIIVPLKSPPW